MTLDSTRDCPLFECEKKKGVFVSTNSKFKFLTFHEGSQVSVYFKANAFHHDYLWYS